MFDLIEIDLAGFKAIADSLRREARVVLVTGKPFLLGRRYNMPILDEGSCTVMVKGGDSKKPHSTQLLSPLRTLCR